MSDDDKIFKLKELLGGKPKAIILVDDVPSGPIEDVLKQSIDRGTYHYDPTNTGRLSKRTKTTRDRPIEPPPSEGDAERELGNAATGAAMSSLRDVDWYGGLSPEEYEKGAKATAEEYTLREQERMDRLFGDLGHDPKFYDMAHQTAKPVRETTGTDVDPINKRVPVITRREELPGDNGIRRTDTTEFVGVDYAPPWAPGNEHLIPPPGGKAEAKASTGVRVAHDPAPEFTDGKAVKGKVEELLHEETKPTQERKENRAGK